MPAKKFTATLPDGVKVTRKSATMDYHFIIAGRVNLVAARAESHNEANVANDKSNYQYSSTVASLGVGKTYPGYTFPIRESDYDKAVAFMAQYPTLDAYLAASLQRRLDFLVERYGTGDRSQWFCLQWSQRIDSARKAVNTHAKYHVDVQVIPVDE